MNINIEVGVRLHPVCPDESNGSRYGHPRPRWYKSIVLNSCVPFAGRLPQDVMMEKPLVDTVSALRIENTCKTTFKARERDDTVCRTGEISLRVFLKDVGDAFKGTEPDSGLKESIWKFGIERRLGISWWARSFSNDGCYGRSSLWAYLVKFVRFSQ